jgi:hypothetical protein
MSSSMQTLVTLKRIRALALLVLAALWFRPTPAVAFDLQGTTIKFKLELPDADGDLVETTDPEKIKDHFNTANCVCSDVEFGIQYSLESQDASVVFSSEDVVIFLGTGCEATPAEISVRDENCIEANTFPDLNEFRLVPTVAYAVHDLLAPNLAECPVDTGTNRVYAIIDEGPRGIEEGDVAAYTDISYDMEPPPIPDNIKGTSAEEAIALSWDLPVGTEDIRYYQVLCARADGGTSPADGFPGSLKPEYLSARSVCGADLEEERPVSVTGEPVTDLPPSLYNLDAASLCGEATGTETSLRVGGLQNGVPYRLVLLTVDDYRNVSAVDIGTHTPQPVEDGWEHYKDAGGQAESGYCYVATATYGNYDHPFVKILRNFRDDTLAHSSWGRSFIAWYYANSPGLANFIAEHESARVVSYLLLAPLVTFAAVWEYTGPLGKLALLLLTTLFIVWRRRTRDQRIERAETRRRPRRALLAAATVLLLIGFSTTAEAQPYWDELNEPLDRGDSTPNWNVDIKFGPYFPDVDSEFDLAADAVGPFEEMYGSSSNLMTIISLDRFFLFPEGQLGVTGSIGFTKQYANAFNVDSAGNTIMGADGKLERSSGDVTKFRLMPTSIGAVYRFTKLDDDFGIPVVPYGKAALSYYIWSFTAPNGEASKYCPDPAASDCSNKSARGGSLGFQASLGIAIRAERIDPGAEVSLRTEMGIEHAGFFAEVQTAQVDGFGADDKLSVGDTTWFGGINFEF